MVHERVGPAMGVELDFQAIEVDSVRALEDFSYTGSRRPKPIKNAASGGDPNGHSTYGRMRES